MGHFLGAHEPVKIFRADKAERDRGLLEAGFLLVSLLGDLSGLIVSDVRVRAVTSISEFLTYSAMRSRFGSIPTAQCSWNESASVGQEAYRIEEIENHDRLENVELEVAL